MGRENRLLRWKASLCKHRRESILELSRRKNNLM